MSGCGGTPALEPALFAPAAGIPPLAVPALLDSDPVLSSPQPARAPKTTSASALTHRGDRSGMTRVYFHSRDLAM
jgi:hypothetical protein